MLFNYLLIAIRNLFKQKAYTLINVSGMAIGITCSIFIILFVNHELSYDRFHTQSENIYRVGVSGKFSGNEFDQAVTAQPMAQALISDYPEVKNVVRLREYGDWLVTYGDNKFHEENMLFADSTFFKIFDFRLIKGDPESVLKEKRTIVLTESMARKYFGDEDPVGKMLKLETDTSLFRVTGLMEDVPGNSHIHFDAVGSLHTYARPEDEFWVSHNFYTYILTDGLAVKEALEVKFASMIDKYVGPQIEDILGMSMDALEEQGDFFGYFLQPLEEIHLNSNLDYEFEPNGNKVLVYIFIIIAALILIVACINFTNLATARSASRSKEVGIRKLAGAQKPMLVGQFLFDSFLLTSLAFLVAAILVSLLIPHFNNMIQLEVNTAFLSTWKIAPLIVLFILLTAFLAGSYPAFYLAAFRPIHVLKGMLVRGTKGGKLRSILVVLQLGVSILILVGTYITFGQMRYLINKDPGFDTENILVIRRSDVLKEKIDAFKQELLRNPGVLSVSNANSIPGRNFSNNAIFVEERGTSNTYLTWQSWVSYDYDEVFSLNIIDGRFFSRDISTDSSGIVINQAAVKFLDLEEPVLGQRLLVPSGQQSFDGAPIIGILEDFHFQSMHTGIQPMSLLLMPGNWEGFIPVKLSGSNMQETIEFVNQTWETFTTEYPFDYFWMNEDYERLYDTEKKTSSIFVSFALISLVIACLGLVGLISFTAVQRTKEIGIRKVMGSTSQFIVRLFLKEIGILVAIATAVAAPVYFIANSWLQNFAYHIEFNVLKFAIILISAGLLTLLLSWISVAWITVHASRKNPVDSLRWE
ncbi:ABC transporter permease [Bacteroidota bacterium]